MATLPTMTHRLSQMKKGDRVKILIDSNGYICTSDRVSAGVKAVVATIGIVTGSSTTLVWTSGANKPNNAYRSYAYPGFSHQYNVNNSTLTCLPMPKLKPKPKVVKVKDVPLGSKIKVFVDGSGYSSTIKTSHTKTATLIGKRKSNSYSGMVAWKSGEKHTTDAWVIIDASNYTEYKRSDDFSSYSRARILYADAVCTVISSPKVKATKKTAKTAKTIVSLGRLEEAKVGDVINIYLGVNGRMTRDKTDTVLSATVVNKKDESVDLAWREGEKTPAQIDVAISDQYPGFTKVLFGRDKACLCELFPAPTAKLTSLDKTKLGDQVRVFLTAKGKISNNKTKKSILATVVGNETGNILLGWKDKPNHKDYDEWTGAFGSSYKTVISNKSDFKYARGMFGTARCEIVASPDKVSTNETNETNSADTNQTDTNDNQPETNTMTNDTKNDTATTPTATAAVSPSDIESYLSGFVAKPTDIENGDKVEVLYQGRVYQGTAIKFQERYYSYSYHYGSRNKKRTIYGCLLDEPSKDCHSTCSSDATKAIKKLGLEVEKHQFVKIDKNHPVRVIGSNSLVIAKPGVVPVKKTTLADVKLGDTVQVYVADGDISKRANKNLYDATVIGISKHGGENPILIGWISGQYVPNSADERDSIERGTTTSARFDYIPGHGEFRYALNAPLEAECVLPNAPKTKDEIIAEAAKTLDKVMTDAIKATSKEEVKEVKEEVKKEEWIPKVGDTMRFPGNNNGVCGTELTGVVSEVKTDDPYGNNYGIQFNNGGDPIYYALGTINVWLNGNSMVHPDPFAKTEAKAETMGDAIEKAVEEQSIHPIMMGLGALAGAFIGAATSNTNKPPSEIVRVVAPKSIETPMVETADIASMSVG